MLADRPMGSSEPYGIFWHRHHNTARRNYIMKFIYPAIIKQTPSGKFKAVFPDLACCEAEADTLEDAVDKANEAAYDWSYLELSEDGHLPPITDIHDLHLNEGEIVRNICVNVRLTDGWDE